MRHLPLAWLIVLAGSVNAQESAPSVPADTAAPTLQTAEEGAPLAKPSPRRMLSADTAAKLAAAVPRYTPPEPVPAPAEPTVSPLLREADKPRNAIVRLPRFVVEEPKPRVSKELQVLTAKGRAELGFQRHPGLRMVPFPALNTGVAVALLEDELAAQRRGEEADLWSLYLVRESPAPSFASVSRPGAR